MTNTTTTLINTMTATTITTAAVVTRCIQTIMQVAKSLFIGSNVFRIYSSSQG